ncbi:unnamed protein product [Linum trigynum]
MPYGTTHYLPPSVNVRSSPTIARNLTAEMEAASSWAHLYPYQADFCNGPSQAHQYQMGINIYQPPLSIKANQIQPNQQHVSQIVEDLGIKLDLNRRPNDFEASFPANRLEEGQAEPKKRKQGQPLDFSWPMFTPGEGPSKPSKPRNARIKVKGRKQQVTAGDEKPEFFEETEEALKQSQVSNSEVKVASLKPPGLE